MNGVQQNGVYGTINEAPATYRLCAGRKSAADLEFNRHLVLVVVDPVLLLRCDLHQPSKNECAASGTGVENNRQQNRHKKVTGWRESPGSQPPNLSTASTSSSNQNVTVCENSPGCQPPQSACKRHIRHEHVAKRLPACAGCCQIQHDPPVLAYWPPVQHGPG